VAVGAPGADILENQIGMALRAGDLLVHAAQRIPRLVVLELRVRPDRLPTRVGVAALARDGKRPVGIRPQLALDW
jgi:hypothetical protein